ncbi:efflux transporter outer membrane subunit [Hydrogenophaga laconesensis]|uniref:NodT family efflux transporter outer membrane factor (OMF) lipoprotein n=1 Tax=Hydrogenophaga laconesensis TaxID=1805971 RepID=A0ABU1VA35_9BURK|nr:efflux transporter outer membrane subunit [Hydrogenophaga laconesensis]MDR7094205.1 NodT family efflux transporter outer membrane factor (OMF) lipoprotein [Hydrogenophaga laconesensis]
MKPFELPLARPLALALVLALQACATTTDPARGPVVDMPAAWSPAMAPAESPQLTAAWWQSFGSPPLERLIEEAQANSPDLRIAIERMRQADIALQQAGISRLPSVNGSLGSSAGRTEAPGTPSTSRESSSAGLSVSYEVDLWGRIAAGVRAGEASFQASQYDWKTARLTLLTSVANNYFLWLNTAERLRIARENLAIAERVLAIVEARQRNGVATALEVSQQRTTVLSQRTALLPIELQQRQTATALALLLGRVPQGYAPEAGEFTQLRVPDITPGLPSSLLTRRPDLASAEAQLAASDANVEAARKALLPSLSLSASGSLGTSALISLADPTRSVSIGISLAQSIFDGGRQRLQIRSTESQRVVLIENYGKAIRTALKEVDDGLGNVERSQRQEALQREVVAQARRSLQLAELRYREGSGDLLSVLDAQRTLFSALDALATQGLSRLTAALDLYKALGGDWAGLPPSLS